jgi:hypothetical protein
MSDDGLVSERSACACASRAHTTKTTADYREFDDGLLGSVDGRAAARAKNCRHLSRRRFMAKALAEWIETDVAPMRNRPLSHERLHRLTTGVGS